MPFNPGIQLGFWLRLGDAGADIVEDIHEVDVAVVWGVVGGEVFVDIAVGPVLGAHVVEVVAGGELAPVVDDVFHFDFAFGVA